VVGDAGFEVFSLSHLLEMCCWGCPVVVSQVGRWADEFSLADDDALWMMKMMMVCRIVDTHMYPN
jgi:hypothetical protein